jgi:hypothetical protein
MVVENALATAQHPGRKHHDAAHQAEHAVNRDAHDAEGNQENPHEGVRHQRQNGQRPAKQQQKAPEEKLSHVLKYDPL